jgi:hypothetical protein
VLGRRAEAEADYAVASPAEQAERGRGLMDAFAGRTGDARRRVEQLEERARTGYSSPGTRGLIWLALGEKERGYKLLLQACAELEPSILDVKVTPLIAPLRADPRFAEVLRCMNLQ